MSHFWVMMFVGYDYCATVYNCAFVYLCSYNSLKAACDCYNQALDSVLSQVSCQTSVDM